MIINYKSELALVHKTQRDLIAELDRRGISLRPNTLSRYLTGVREMPSFVRYAIDEILSEWRKQK